ncbi:hypothetical protein ACIOV9_12750 [Pseudomonas iridis]|jgi:hypothetical protein|uniref:hypothetical protein n=1 Tax=Pseudomonas iridis TaxID=2710587 RepID=UPI00380C0042
MSLVDVFRARVELVIKYLEILETQPRQLKFTSADLLDPDTLSDLHDKFPRKSLNIYYIYHLSFDGEENSIASRARTAFRSEREAKIWNLSRDNKQHLESSSLYVGSSECMHSRFRPHLGKGQGKTTWSLYLAKWAGSLNTKFILEYYELKDMSSEDVELVEGVLWDSFKPLFGKKGGR